MSEARAIVLGGLPDLSPEAARAFYDQALRSLPATRARGFYGVVDGGPERPDDVALFLYADDKMTPILNLTMSRADLIAFAEALNALVEERLQHGRSDL